MKKYLKQILPDKICKILLELRNLLFDTYYQKSYSQEGEDMILRRMFERQTTGFYVDVGAHHPKRFSNTYFFYKLGWRGINIDAMPGSMKLFRRYRPNDINLEIPVSEKKESLTYYAFNEPALNGFSKELAEKRNGLDNYKIIFEKVLETATLQEILDSYLPLKTKIDFLSLDVEGFDLKALMSNNWAKYSPKVVLVEVLGNTLEELMESEITIYLKQQGYQLSAKCYNTVIYKHKSFS